LDSSLILIGDKIREFVAKLVDVYNFSIFVCKNN
jgi:hypothetical protein